MSTPSPFYDLVVIGGGPGGYAAAIRAGQLGKKVACIEMERAGGTCLNWGCIPTKALLKSAELYQSMLHSEDFGFRCDTIQVDFQKVIQRSRGVADTMGKGIEYLFRKNKVDYLRGKGQISAPGMVTILDGPDQGQLLSCQNILIATGCRARQLPGLVPDGRRIMTSKEALALSRMPASIIILGAGAIGVEFAYFLNAFGCKVTLVEMLPRILPVEDEEVSQTLHKALQKQGINIHVRTQAGNIQVLENSVRMNLQKDQEQTTLETEALLVAIGLTPNTEDLFSERIHVTMNKGYINVDERYQTNIEGIYAAGDIIGAPWLAHVATYEAVQAVNGIFGYSTPKKVTYFPGCTYSNPQVASIGLTEQKAKELNIPYKIGKFPFRASGKAVATNHTEGFVKILVEPHHGEILGAHIVGPEATELITEYALAMNLEATAEDIHATIHAHPTLSEALAEAAADVEHQAIHI